MTAADRDELRALSADVVPGRWVAKHGVGMLASSVWFEVASTGREVLVADGLNEFDAAFIAAARQAVPALLDALEQAEARIQAVETAFDDHNIEGFLPEYRLRQALDA